MGKPIITPEEYYQSIRDMKTPIWAFGELRTDNPDFKLFKPHVDAVALIYKVAMQPEYDDLMNATSHLTGKRISRFNHIHQGTDDLLKKVRMLRMINNKSACCIQRCAGTDALNATYIVTYEIDKKYGTDYHQKFKKYLTYLQDENKVVIGAMTDVKGDRTKKPSAQRDPDLHVHVVEERKDGIVVRGAKVHITGVTSAHEVMVFPTTNLGATDIDYACVFSLPINTPGITYIFGRQSNDGRKLEEGTIDMGNPFGVVGGECMMVFNDVFVPWENIYMYKQYEFAGMFVEAFATAHRQNYGACKGGIGDVLLGAVYDIAASMGIAKASAVRDKMADMIHMIETGYACSIACSCEGARHESGAWKANTMLANTSKHNITKFVYEENRLAQDICGGILATLPSEADFRNPTVGPLIEKYLQAVEGYSTEERMRMFRLVECLTGGTACVEAMHGAGPPAAQKVMYLRDANFDYKVRIAKDLVGIK